MARKKVVYYSDLLNDDFADNGFKSKPLPEKYKHVRRNPLYRFCSAFVYYVIAFPLIWIFAKLVFGFKVVGKKKLKKAHLKGGYFLYGNHVSMGDILAAPVSIAAPHRIRIVCSQETMSIGALRWFIQMLGGYPLPNERNLEQGRNFVEGIYHHVNEGNVILIYPEAHIWPYCTFIRPFDDKSFGYPAKSGKPVVSMCTTFRERKVLRFLPPKITIHVSEPFYPDMSKGLRNRAIELRDAVYDHMVETSSSFENFEWVEYLEKPGKNDEA